jgi:hypothetical protein
MALPIDNSVEPHGTPISPRTPHDQDEVELTLIPPCSLSVHLASYP